MMLVSKEIRKRLAVLVLGTSMIGCSSGPGTSFTRFWPGCNQDEAPVASAAKVDEDLAAKWRDRINDTSAAENSQFQVAAAEPVEVKEEKSSRFNLLKKLPWSRKAEEEEAKQADLRAQADRERADLEQKLAELEAEKRRLAAGGNPSQGSKPQYGLDRKDELTDPFLAAERLAKKDSPSADFGKPAAEKSLPAWARSGEIAPTTPQATKSDPAEEVAVSGNNAFMPGFDETLKNLQATVAEQDAQKAGQEQFTAAKSAAPAMPLDDPAPVAAKVEPSRALPLDPVVTSPKSEAVSQPQLEQPIADNSAADHPLNTNKSVAEQRRDWATLEVQQLMKRARIEARAADYKAAVNSALEAEQLANNAKIEFAADEQTPWELISAIRNVTSGSSSVAATPAPQPLPKEEVGRASVIVKPAVAPRPNVPTPTEHSFIASRKQTHPLQSDQNLRRAEFLNPQPSLKPKTVAVPDWSSQAFAKAAPAKAPQAGNYMESPSAFSANRGPSAQFVSSSNSGADSNANIYSPENLQWTTLDATLATLNEQQRAAVPEPPQFVEAPVSTSDDPFAAFAGVEVEDAPLVAAAPASSESVPTSEEASEAAQSNLVFGIPLRKLALVGLAGLIFLAAIIHRRRHNPLHL